MVPFNALTCSIKIRSESTENKPRNGRPVVSPDDTDCSVTPSQTHKSQSIPITNGIHRTLSEIQLCEDEALADYRDYCMYTRIVDGIQRRQSSHSSGDIDLIYENDACLANIRRTRCQPPEESHSLKTRHDSLLQVLRDPSLKTTHDFLTEATAIHQGTIFDQDYQEDDEGVFVIDL